MVLKKKEIIAASLVVLIGVAGYLNWSYQDTIRVQDGESYVETGKKLGEAQYVSSDTVAEETSTDNAEQNDSEQAEETAVTEDDGRTGNGQSGKQCNDRNRVGFGQLF